MSKPADSEPRTPEAQPAGRQEHAAAPRGQVSSNGRVMPADYSISLPVGGGVTRPDGDYSRRRQSLRGFEDEYTDIVDYIVRITHRIWEDQDFGYIYDTYSPGCRVFDDSGPRHGIEEMVAGTVQAVAAFPNMRHYADEVIWAGDDEQGFVTSHRALNIGDHSGHWRWGPPTHRRLNTWVIANCVIKDNEIYEEWVLYNTAAKLQQLGLDVAACAREFGNATALRPLADREITEVERLVGGRKPSPLPEPDTRGAFDVEEWAKALFHNTYNRRDLSTIDRAYAPNVRWYGTTNRSGYGRARVRAMARSLLSTFPDLGVHVDEVYWMGNPEEGYRVSVRWGGSGTHKGYTLYGAPTGRQVHIWGMSQLYVQGGRIVEDWTLFNEFDVMAQLLRDEPPALL